MSFSQSLRLTPVATEDTEKPGTKTPAKATETGPAYILREMIGSGGFGEVWEGVQTSLDRIVAIKRLRQSLYDNKEPQRMQILEQAFQKEALVTGWLDHPNIVPVYDLGLDQNGRPLLGMKMIRGTAWNAMLEKDRTMPNHERLAKHLRILLAVSQAMAFAHSRGVIHRDLKPAQVIIGKYGEVFLMDWGLAVSFADSSTSQISTTIGAAASLKDAPNPAGTVSYMAPEQTEQTGENLGPWTDVYLLGGILYFILTGTPPHPQKDALKAWGHAVQGYVEPAEVRAPKMEIPSELSQLCTRTLAGHIRQRPYLVEFIKGIEHYLAGTSRREQSREVAAQVKKRLAAAQGAYEELAQCDNLITSALLLWPENREANELQSRVLAAFVSAATASGDVKLARVKAAKVMDFAERQKLIAIIDAAVHRVEMRLLGYRLTIVLLISVIVVLVSKMLHWL